MTENASPLLADTHYRGAVGTADLACGLRTYEVMGFTDNSAAVTCPACISALLEQPMDTRGRREYQIPESVCQQDAQRADGGYQRAAAAQREKQQDAQPLPRTLRSLLADERAQQEKLTALTAELLLMREQSLQRSRRLMDELKNIS